MKNGFQSTMNLDDLQKMKQVAESTTNSNLQQQFFEFRENNKEKYDEHGRLKQGFNNQLNSGKDGK